MSYRGGARAGSGSGPSFAEKAKAQMRMLTPDSEALASSDEDHEHPPSTSHPPATLNPPGRRPSTGWLHDIQPNRKYSLPTGSLAGSQPTTPAAEMSHRTSPSTFQWNTPSFSTQTDNRALRLKEIVPSPTTIVPAGDRALPSPTVAESDEGGIGFLLNQNPPRKSVRSQSYSAGQSDLDTTFSNQFPTRLRNTSLRHRPSKPSLLGEPSSGLGQLREDDADEVESSNGSEHGIRLASNHWDQQQQRQNPGPLLKQVALENARARHRATSTSSPVSQHHRKATQAVRSMSRTESDYAVEEIEDLEHRMDDPIKASLTRRFSEHVAGVYREPDFDHLGDIMKKPQWGNTSSFGIGMDPLGRRHSFATVGSHHGSFPLSTLSKTYEEDEVAPDTVPPSQSPMPNEQFDASAYFTGRGPASRALNASAVSAAHPDPSPQPTSIPPNPYIPSALGRPGKRLYVVAFKCSRADIYYLYDNTGLEITRGDLVIVEGDRGCDLGQVTHVDVSPEDAKKYKAEAAEEHFRWLVMFSSYSLAGNSNDPGMLGALARANGQQSSNRASMQAMGFGVQQEQETKPKMIKRLAQTHEIHALRDKEGQEAKAKRVGAQKAAEHKLPMEILDAEYQADYHKLTYFYYAEAYVNFNELVTDLFKQYKVRIWMSAVNPASVVHPTGLMQVPPPSALGPGAILPTHSANAALPVGPGFGGASYRGNDQYGRTGGANAQGNAYEDAFYNFSHQMPSFNGPAQGQYGVQWAQGQQSGQDAFNRYNLYPVAAGGYPSVSTSGTPVNYGAYYPPATYSSSPAYPMHSGASAPSYPSQPTPGPLQGKSYSYQGHHRQPLHGNYTTNSAHGGTNGHNAIYSPSHDAGLASAIQNMSISK